MDKNFSKGQRLFVYLNDEDSYFEGEFFSINADRSRITLSKVIRHPDKKVFTNEYHFFRCEVKDIESLQAEGGMEAVLDANHGRSLSHHKGPSHAHLFRMSGQTLTNTPSGAPRISDNRRNHEKYKVYQKALETFNIIDRMDSSFVEALEEIDEASVIGVGVEGVFLGRFGTLCWISVATGSNTFLFDMLALGQRGFNEGLRQLLQSEAVTKVMHDCRMAADCLTHQHNVKMANVMDTQVLDLMVQRGQRERCPGYVKSLNNTLNDYLGIPKEILRFPMVREEHLKRDMNKWAVRPLGQGEVEMLVQSVAFLLELRSCELRALLEPAVLGSQHYLEHVTSMPQEDAHMYYGCIHMTPRQLYSIGRRRRDEDRGMERLNPNIRFSRDVMHYYDAPCDPEEGDPNIPSSATLSMESSTIQACDNAVSFVTN